MPLTRATEGKLVTQTFDGDGGLPSGWTNVNDNRCEGVSVGCFGGKCGFRQSRGDNYALAGWVTADGSATTDQVLQWEMLSSPWGSLPNYLYPGGVLRAGNIGGAYGDYRDNYTFYCTHTGSGIYKRVSGSWTLLASSATVCASGDKHLIAAVGTSLTWYRNGVSFLSATDSAVTSGVAGYRHEVRQCYCYSDNCVVTTGYTITVSGLSAGHYAQVYDGTSAAKAAQSGGVATVDCRALWSAQTGMTVRVYNGDPDAGGTLLVSETGAYMGDAWAYEAPAAAPTISAITPSSGYNDEAVSITDLAGTGFLTGAGVKLKRSGQADIDASNVVVVSGTKITCDLNLVGAATGLWTPRVTNTDEQYGELVDGFTVSARPAAAQVRGAAYIF